MRAHSGARVSTASVYSPPSRGQRAGDFVAELWEILIDASNSPHGIPSAFIERKKAQLVKQKEEAEARAAKRNEARRTARTARSPGLAVRAPKFDAPVQVIETTNRLLAQTNEMVSNARTALRRAHARDESEKDDKHLDDACAPGAADDHQGERRRDQALDDHAVRSEDHSDHRRRDRGNG